MCYKNNLQIVTFRTKSYAKKNGKLSDTLFTVKKNRRSNDYK